MIPWAFNTIITGRCSGFYSKMILPRTDYLSPAAAISGPVDKFVMPIY